MECKVDIKEKSCPGCGDNMKAMEVNHTMKTRVYIRWDCNKCIRSFGFYYAQETKELPSPQTRRSDER